MRKRKREAGSFDPAEAAGGGTAEPATGLAALRGYPFVLGLISMALLTASAAMMGSLELVWRGVFLSAAVVFLGVVGYAAWAHGGAGSIVGIFVLALPLFVAPTVIVTPRMPRGGGGWPVTYTAAPVVPAGWTPSEPVHFWLVAQSGTRDPVDWSAASTSGVRLGQDNERDKAIVAIAQKAGLVSADTRILLRWSPDPGEDLRSAWLSLAGIVGLAAIAWTATVVAFRVRR